MKIIFNKDDLPLVGRVADGNASPREYWQLACRMRDENGFRKQDSVKVMLLQKGAFQGDPWSMCELARHYYSRVISNSGTAQNGFSGEGESFPLALSWWKKAAVFQDPGAGRDLTRLEKELETAIAAYRSGGEEGQEYEDLELRCAMLTEWILTRMGRDCWDVLEFEEKRRRVQVLMDVAAAQLHIRPVKPKVEEKLIMADGREAGGLAYINDRKIGLRRCDFDDYHRLIQVIFHELGHFVVYSILRDDGAKTTAAEQMKRFCITEERVNAWKRGDKGIHVPVGEEDPDTLSYGVYTCWMVLFG